MPDRIVLAASDVLRAHGVRAEGSLPLEVLEALAAVLTEHDAKEA